MSNTSKPLRDNIEKIKKAARLIFKVHTDGAVQGGLLTEKEVRLASLLGAGLIAVNSTRSERMRILDLQAQIEEANNRIERDEQAIHSFGVEINEKYRDEEIDAFFEHLGIKEETKEGTPS